MLLGRPSPDIDVAVESQPAEFGKALASELGGHFVFHKRFLTGTVRLACRHIDISQTRTETYPRPAVLPVVRPASIEEDLRRRDFTINAIAFELTPESFGRLIDPQQGQADISRRQVRVLHDRSFIDDPTRIFRAIRFAVRLNFAIELKTLELLRQSVKAGYPGRLTPERILYELRLVCAEPLVLPMFEAIIHEHVLESAMNWQRPRGFLLELQKLVRNGVKPNSLFLWLLGTLPVNERFPITKEEREAAAAMRYRRQVTRQLSRVCRASAVYRLLRPLPEATVHILGALAGGRAREHIANYLGRYKDTKPFVTGADLRALGLRPGPAYQRLLNRLLYARLDGTIRTMADELAWLRRVARIGTR